MTIAASGGHEPEVLDCLFGKMRSRASAKLKYTKNDVRALRDEMPTFGGYMQGLVHNYDLVDPSKGQLLEGIRNSSEELSRDACEPNDKKVLNVFYAGHGQPLDGSWELRDGSLSGQELHQAISAGYADAPNRLHVNLLLDSCYSSRFLIDVIVSARGNDIVHPFDCTVSSLTDEKSYEMDFLEHGAMSFHLTHTGNSYVESQQLAKAIDERDQRTIVAALQGVTVPNPVTFLTNGRQHCVVLTSGHYLEVQGGGGVELSDHITSLTCPGIADALDRAKTAYGSTVEYEG